MTFKKCTCCNVEKEIENFPKGVKYKNGRRGVCKLCTKNYSKKHKIIEGDYKCIVCEKTKPHTEFNSCPQNNNGLRCSCKECIPKRDFTPRYFNNINLRLSHCLRTRIRHAINSQNVSKNNRTPELVGCSVIEIKKYLEEKFTEGMTWENYGEWHIDHIRPCSSFNLEDPEEQKRCFHWTNLQPLWAKDNLSKGARLDWVKT